MIGRIFFISLSACLIGAPAQEAWCQKPAKEKVRLESCDGVTLRGWYYPGWGRNSPAVLFLHELGGSHNCKEWTPLAVALARKGYAVFAFDFRGHGFSTEIEANSFWANQYNKALVRGAGGNEISCQDFDPRYYPVLANDIAAAKAFLDRRNNDGRCNSSNLVVIGAGQGATLGALWVNAEYNRYTLRLPLFFNQPPQIQEKPESQNILCALWVSIQPQLGNRKVHLPALLYPAGAGGKLPMVFLHGAEDAVGKKIARRCESTLLAKTKLPFTGKVPLPDYGGQADAAMLKEPAAVDAVIDYLENLRSEEGNEWVKHDFRTSQSVWRWRGGFIAANQPGNSSLNFNGYEGFLP